MALLRPSDGTHRSNKRGKGGERLALTESYTVIHTQFVSPISCVSFENSIKPSIYFDYRRVELTQNWIVDFCMQHLQWYACRYTGLESFAGLKVQFWRKFDFKSWKPERKKFFFRQQILFFCWYKIVYLYKRTWWQFYSNTYRERKPPSI